MSTGPYNTADDAANPDNWAPSVFISDQNFPPGGTVVIPPLPRSDGGLIQSVKGAMLTALRDALGNTTMFDKKSPIYVDLDYPLVQTQYPGVWVQFTVSKLARAGLGHEVPVQNEDETWSFIQEWTFMGTVSLTVVALKSRDRDKISDALIAMLAFARTPQLVITKNQADVKQNRALLNALDNNPYVAISINTDTITPGGQQATQGTPWQNDALIYEDTYSFDMVGQFNIKFSNDGLYTLSRIDPVLDVISGTPEYNEVLWADQPPFQPGSAPAFGGAGNPANVDFPM